MLMKEYLIETFLFNDQMNKQMLKKMEQLPDKKECTRFFSHLINSQNKCPPDRTGRDDKDIAGFESPGYELVGPDLSL
jgi:hypothetical protein